MTEPTELQKSLIDEATYLRGRIITSYSQIEFLLADISVKRKRDLMTAYHVASGVG